ncbi:MAG: RNA polymerase sigma factor [Brucellaceae bacterium]|nr:RNA polymerase sigma factor [Brucellaceae bacterium]
MSRQGRDTVRDELADHLVRLWRYGLVLSGKRDTAEDLVQMTCLRALERPHQFQPGTRLDRWLFSILRSIWLNEIRARRVREDHALSETGIEVPDGEANDIETGVLARQVLRRIASLPRAQSETVLLVCAEGYTYREAADLLGVPVGTIMSRLATARAALVQFGADEPADLSRKEDKP